MNEDFGSGKDGWERRKDIGRMEGEGYRVGWKGKDTGLDRGKDTADRRMVGRRIWVMGKERIVTVGCCDDRKWKDMEGYVGYVGLMVESVEGYRLWERRRP